MKKKIQEMEFDLITVTECAKLLAMKVSSIYQLTHKKEIPYYKIKGLIRFKRSEVLEWFEDNFKVA